MACRSGLRLRAAGALLSPVGRLWIEIVGSVAPPAGPVVQVTRRLVDPNQMAQNDPHLPFGLKHALRQLPR
ncbi:hypothetical protein FQZ97_283060 [compost metagenome]